MLFDMSTIIGIIIGVFATVVVGHYYFRRTINKSLAIYATLSNRIFAGIESEDRKNLKFYFKESEVKELSQVEFIVANDGERAIRDCIEPLSLTLPKGVKVLDATLLYLHPEKLLVTVNQKSTEFNQQVLEFDFPLLNKGEFFLVKLLLDGRLDTRSF